MVSRTIVNQITYTYMHKACAVRHLFIVFDTYTYFWDTQYEIECMFLYGNGRWWCVAYKIKFYNDNTGFLVRNNNNKEAFHPERKQKRAKMPKRVNSV